MLCHGGEIGDKPTALMRAALTMIGRIGSMHVTHLMFLSTSTSHCLSLESLCSRILSIHTSMYELYWLTFS